MKTTDQSRRLRQHGVVVMLSLALAGCGRQPDGTESSVQPTESSAPLLQAEGNAEQAAPTPSALEESASDSALPVYELKMNPKDMLALQRNPYANDTWPATFIAGTEVFEGVKVRARGAFSRSWPKKSLKIIFNHERTFGGHRSLDLNSGWRDPAFVRETLAYHVYAACGAPASRSRIVRLNLNGKFRGIYVEVEQPDKGFLERLNWKGASVYKAASRSNRADERDLGNEEAYRAHYSKETQKASGYGELRDFCREIQSAPNALEFFNQRIEVEKYINFLAATVLTQNWDGFDKNHFLIYDGQGSRKWLVIPWDLDRTFGDHWHGSFEETRLPVLLGTRRLPGITGWSRLEERFMSEPTLRGRFLDRLQDLLQNEFTAEKLFPLIDRIEAQTAAEAARDRRAWPAPAPDFHSAIAEVKSFITERREFLLQELPRLRRPDAMADDR